jgi:hypothetical protein
VGRAFRGIGDQTRSRREAGPTRGPVVPTQHP